MAAEKLQFTFKPEEQSIPLPIAIMDDTLLEQTEAFLLQLQLFVDRGPQFAAGKFLSAIVTIQDNDSKQICYVNWLHFNLLLTLLLSLHVYSCKCRL